MPTSGRNETTHLLNKLRGYIWCLVLRIQGGILLKVAHVYTYIYTHKSTVWVMSDVNDQNIHSELISTTNIHLQILITCCSITKLPRMLH